MVMCAHAIPLNRLKRAWWTDNDKATLSNCGVRVANSDCCGLYKESPSEPIAVKLAMATEILSCKLVVECSASLPDYWACYKKYSHLSSVTVLPSTITNDSRASSSGEHDSTVDSYVTSWSANTRCCIGSGYMPGSLNRLIGRKCLAINICSDAAVVESFKYASADSTFIRVIGLNELMNSHVFVFMIESCIKSTIHKEKILKERYTYVVLLWYYYTTPIRYQRIRC